MAKNDEKRPSDRGLKEILAEIHVLCGYFHIVCAKCREKEPCDPEQLKLLVEISAAIKHAVSDKLSTLQKRPYKTEQEAFLPIRETISRSKMLQYYTWSREDAEAAQKEWEGECAKTGPEVWRDPMTMPLEILHAVTALKSYYQEYLKGTKSAILEALNICASQSWPIPIWCAIAFSEALNEVEEYEVKSWDDVFGRPHPSGMHLGAKKQEWGYSLKVFSRIEQIKKKEPATPIDGALFERVGREFGIGGKTLTEEYYYKWKRVLGGKDL